MAPFAKKILSLQFLLFIFVGAVLGVSVIKISGMSPRLMIVAFIAMVFPFVGFLVGNVRRFLLAMIAMSIPLHIDVNFRHIMENQAGAATLGISLRDVFVVLLLIVWIIEMATSEEKTFRFFARVTLPAIIYLEACLLTFLWAPRLDLATLEIVQMVKVFVLYFIVANEIRDKSDLKLIIWVLCLTVAFEGTIATIQMITGKSLSLGFLGELQIRQRDISKLMRAGGTMGHPNRLAMFLEFLLPLVFGAFLLEKRSFPRMVVIAVFALGIATMVMTGSRGGWGAMLVSIIIFFGLLIRNKHVAARQIFGPALITMVMMAVVYLIFSDTIHRRLFGEDYGSAMSRIPMFQIAFSIIENHPVGGVGINNYAVVMREYNNTILGRRFGTIPRPVHNLYLLITGETGFIGLASFLLLAFTILRTLVRTILSSDIQLSIIAISIFSGFIAFFVHGFVDKHPAGSNPLFYLLMALTVAAFSLATEENEVSQRLNPAQNEITSRTKQSSLA